MHEAYISSLSQFLDKIERITNNYPSSPIVNNPTVNLFVYRGLSDSAYSLLPGIFRKNTTIINEHKIENHNYLAWNNELTLLRSFIQEACSIVSIPSDELLRWAEYAQHYGVPTRLLDWTSNPLTALYFSCKSRTDKEGSVWMLHRVNYNKFISKHMDDINSSTTIKEIITDLISGKKGTEFPIIYNPYYVDSRMSAQGSCFMVWGNNTNSLEELLNNDKYYMDFSKTDDNVQVYGTDQETNVLFRFLIYPDRKQVILRELDTVGINEKTLFPGLDGIGRYIERKNRFDYDEGLLNW